MQVHANEKFLRAVVDARIAGDHETLRQMMDPEIVVHFPGRSRLAGDHRGPGALNVKVMELTGNTLDVELHSVLASDEGAVGVYTMRAARGGATLSWRQMNLYVIRGERIVEVWQHPFELGLVDAFFA